MSEPRVLPPVDGPALGPVVHAGTWRARERAHAARVDVWLAPHLARRRAGERHPVWDFLFTYYSQRPAALRRWHPGYAVGLADGAALVAGDGRAAYVVDEAGVARVCADALVTRLPLLRATRRLLAATASRPATLSCFGLHEWAMVHGAPPDDPDGVVRHAWPLRLGAAGTDAVVEAHPVRCSHFDAFRFFTPSAAPLNRLRPSAGDRPDFEQPGCLHAGMDLYKHAFRLTPLVASELVADCFALARDIRALDMAASPYDFADLGFAPVRIETPEGRASYAAAQRVFAERAAPLRAALLAECDRLLALAPVTTSVGLA